MMRDRLAGSQRGVVLVLSMIMLLVVTLMVVTASNLVQTDLKVVQNLESREMAHSAALAAIEQAISSGSDWSTTGTLPRFIQTPTSMFSVPCPGKGNNDLCYDVNQDGINDVTVSVAPPTCTSVTPTPNSELDVFNSREQASCFLPPAVYSMCAFAVWDFQATATDAVTGAKVVVRQGVSVLSSLNKIDSVCP
jgi:hypothetical protein